MMSKKLYYTVLATTTAVTIAILAYCGLSLENTTLPQLLFWMLIGSVCESQPVYFSKGRVVSVTFAILLALQLSHGTYAATLVAASSIVFFIIKNEDGTYTHTFNFPLSKTLMNLVNFTFSAFFAGLAYDALSGWIGDKGTYMFIPLMIAYLSFVFIINTVIMTAFMKLLTGCPLLSTWMKGALWAVPNYLAIMPLGFFINKLYENPSGMVYVIMLFGPLLLARRSFKLYLDSREQYYKVIKTLTAAIEARDPYTEGHSKRVEYYSERIARKLGYTPGRIEAVKVAALLHDIGKIGIEDAILYKKGSLTSDEWDRIRQHPIIGVKILEDVISPKSVLDAILHHHERYDGSGYPDGLKMGQVSTDAYILGAADAFDAMTSDRVYRKALSRDTAISILANEKGKQFYPEVADALISVLLEEDRTQYGEAENMQKAEADYVY